MVVTYYTKLFSTIYFLFSKIHLFLSISYVVKENTCDDSIFSTIKRPISGDKWDNING